MTSNEINPPVGDKVPLPQPRPLTDKERALMEFLLAGPLGRDELRQQAETVRVVGVCSCGCPSIFLEVDEAAPAAVFTESEVLFGRPDWVRLTAVQPKRRGTTEVTLHVCAGHMLELEIWGGEYGLRPRVDVAKLRYFDRSWADEPR